MLRLHAGVSKNVGLPGHSRASASCTIEAKLGIREASNLLDELKSDEPTASPSTNGNGAYAMNGDAR